MTTDREAVAAVWSRMAAGDASALADMLDQWGPLLRLIAGENMRTAARRPATSDELDDLVSEYALALWRLAGAWRPGGALPWHWAALKLRELTNAYIGTWTRPQDEDTPEPEAEPLTTDFPGDEDPVTTLTRLARTDPRCARYLDRLTNAIPSERDRRLYLVALIEKAADSPAPLVTAAEHVGLRRDAARQAFRRASKRMDEAAS